MSVANTVLEILHQRPLRKIVFEALATYQDKVKAMQKQRVLQVPEPQQFEEFSEGETMPPKPLSPKQERAYLV
jgi:hypothetical protein